MLTDKVERIKKMYPEGTRIMLDYLDAPYVKMQPGTVGTVTFVDGIGTIHMRWENGSSLGLVVGVDRFHKIGGED